MRFVGFLSLVEVFASRVTGRWDDEALEAGKEAGATDRLRPGYRAPSSV
jgi:hypothetical protein